MPRLKGFHDNLCAPKPPLATAQATLGAQLAIYAKFPAHVVASVTADNGSEFTLLCQLADAIGASTHFADPYSVWQPDTNGRLSGRIRKYLPRRTSFADLHQSKLYMIIAEINDRPREILGWATPAEVFKELFSPQATSHKPQATSRKPQSLAALQTRKRA
jgi:IS30 family transposase